MTLLRHYELLVVLAALACESSPPESTSASAETAGIDTLGSSSAATDADSSAGTTGDPGDPEYPRPSPVDANGTCPDGTFGPITFDGSAWICIPECDEDSMCPQAATGTAVAECATNPFSSGDPCESAADCTADGELCGNVGGGAKGCLLPPSHCIVKCDAETTCPDDMVCGSAGVCAYPP
jgi:hypothetical protein